MALISRFLRGISVLRPRAAAQVRKSVDDLRVQAREQRTSARRLEAQLTQLGEQHREHAAATAQLLAGIRRDLDTLMLRESQVRAIVQADLDQAGAMDDLARLLAEPEPIHAHVAAAIAAADLRTEPFPYMVVDDVLPRPVFDALVAGLPPAPLFAERPVNHQHLKPPFDLAPRYSRRIWGFMSEVIVPEFVMPAVLARFRDPLNAWIRSGFCRAEPDPLADLRMTTSDGRLLLRRRGYRIPPHRDPKWGFITHLLYLPRPGDDERWGTQLYSVRNDAEAEGAKAYWIKDEERCTPAADIPFRANRMLVFLNSAGAHGAFIPEDAEPADLERYAYQFRIGPNAPSIARLMGGLPEERKPYWAGKPAADYY